MSYINSINEKKGVYFSMNKSSLRKFKTQIGCLKFFDWKEDKLTHREKIGLVQFGFHCNVKSDFLKKRIFCAF